MGVGGTAFHCDVAEREALPVSLREGRMREDAEAGSAALLSTLQETGNTEDPQGPRPALTFDEQLRAVSEGRARVVAKWSPPSTEPGFTLGGVVQGFE